jgi:hypothetical protein
MISKQSKPETLDLKHTGAAASSWSELIFSMLLTVGVAFFVALSIYFAVTESPGRINHDMSEAFASPQSKATEISLAGAAWGHIANAFHYMVTAIPPPS